MQTPNKTTVTGERKAARVQVRIKNEIWPFEPEHPNGWRGEIALIARIFGRDYKASYFPANRQNDWRRVDTATRFNVSPRFAKWFHFFGYYAGMGRNIYHLTIGHIGFSVVPNHSGGVFHN
jgi:hypothetical protein